MSATDAAMSAGLIWVRCEDYTPNRCTVVEVYPPGALRPNVRGLEYVRADWRDWRGEPVQVGTRLWRRS